PIARETVFRRGPSRLRGRPDGYGDEHLPLLRSRPFRHRAGAHAGVDRSAADLQAWRAPLQAGGFRDCGGGGAGRVRRLSQSVPVYWKRDDEAVMTQQKVKVGIISANWSLKVHGSAWRLLPGVEVAAICTAHRETAEAAAQAFGIRKAYWDFEQMTADPELDIIDVGTRPSFRQAMVLAALRNGKHVYSALPFATDTATAAQLCAEQQRHKRVGVVDAQFR